MENEFTKCSTLYNVLLTWSSWTKKAGSFETVCCLSRDLTSVGIRPSPNSNEFVLAVAEDQKKIALLKTILNARKQRQLIQQVMNSVRHGKRTLFEAKSRHCCVVQGKACRAIFNLSNWVHGFKCPARVKVLGIRIATIYKTRTQAREHRIN